MHTVPAVAINVPFLFFFYFSASICCFFVCSLRIRRVARRSTASNHKWRQRQLQRRAGGARDRRDASARSAAVKLKCKLQLPLNCPSCCSCCCCCCCCCALMTSSRPWAIYSSALGHVDDDDDDDGAAVGVAASATFGSLARCCCCCCWQSITRSRHRLPAASNCNCKSNFASLPLPWPRSRPQPRHAAEL